MVARRFFYVCAGVLMLAIAYQLGVSTAHGQAGGAVTDADDPGLGSYVVTSSGAVYLSGYSSYLAVAPHWSFVGTIPGSSPIVRITSAGNGIAHAFAENGNFYVSADGGKTWSLHGNVFGGPTPALQQSWGQLKSRYAPSHAPTSQTPTNR